MHSRYAGKWMKTFTFMQTTEVYRNDSLKRKDTWYEAAEYPDKFRIDFALPDSGNAVIFKGDSSYRFRRGKLLRAEKGANDLTFLLGGMYFYSYEIACSKMNELGYDLQKSFTTLWKGEPVYVIGASADNEKVNQIWVDKEKLVIVRLLKYDDRRKEEGIFEKHLKLGDSYTETKVTFYFDDKLAQIEYYFNCTANPLLDDRLFEPTKFGEWHWYKK